MNLIQLQDRLKNFSQDQLIQEMQMPSGSVPQYLVLSEIMRRKKAEQDFAAAQAPQTTVAEDAVNAAGVPQEGIAGMAQAMAPKTDIAGNTGAQPMQGMANGGMLGPSYGSQLERDPAIAAMAQRMGIPVADYVAMLGSGRRAGEIQRVLGARVTQPTSMVDLDPRLAVQGMPLPSQGDLDRGYAGRSQMAMAAESAPPNVPTVQTPSSLGMPGSDINNMVAGFIAPEEGYDSRVPRAMAGANRIGFELGPNEDQFGRFMDGAGVVGRSARPADEQAMATEILLRDAARQPVASEGLPSIDRGETRPPWMVERDRMMEINDPQGGGLPRTLGGELILPPEALKDEASDNAPQGVFGRLKDSFLEGYNSVRDRAAGRVPEGDVPATFEAEEEANDAVNKAIDDAAATQEAYGDTPAGGVSGGGSGGSGAGGVGNSGLSSFESEILDAIKRRERAAEQDKWLALARVGLQLMSSRQPTLGGALGEAGAAGLESYQETRDDYEEDRLGLVSALYQARAQQAAAAARAAGRAASGGAPSFGMDTDTKRMFDVYTTMVEEIDTALAQMPDDATKADLMQQRAEYDAVRRMLIGAPTTPAGAGNVSMPSAGG